LPLFLAILLAAILLANRSEIRFTSPPVDGGQAPQPVVAATSDRTVSLVVEFGDGQRRDWTDVPWRDGMTVADVLATAAASSAGEPFSYSQANSGASAFLTEMSGAANEGAAGRNWTYQVNGKHADRSFAVYVLQPGDQVLWKFDTGR
jgi:hypothetical protein